MQETRAFSEWYSIHDDRVKVGLSVQSVRILGLLGTASGLFLDILDLILQLLLRELLIESVVYIVKGGRSLTWSLLLARVLFEVLCSMCKSFFCIARSPLSV